MKEPTTNAVIFATTVTAIMTTVALPAGTALGRDDPTALGRDAPTAPARDDLGAALTSGEAHLDLRYRYELVDQDGFSSDAQASTLRLRLNYATGAWSDWSGFVEFDQVLEVLLDDYDSGAGTSSGERSRFPAIADPNGSDLNQLYLEFAPEDWQVRIGRRRILLDDQRFVGGVGWRQNEQTYDGVSVQYTGLRDAELFYSYVVNVNRIFGSDVPAGDHEQDTHLLHAAFRLSDDLKFTGYAYLIDNDDAPAFSTDTFGARAEGGLPLAGGRLALLGDLAYQSDAGDSPADYDTFYFRLQGVWSANALSAGIGLESLGSDNDQGFRTPLATLHAFNGWADQFLATPGAGLEDLYLKLGYDYARWRLQLVYHDFSAETGGADYGSEIDASADRPIGDRYKLLVKLARFDADGAGFADTTKAWIMLSGSF